MASTGAAPGPTSAADRIRETAKWLTVSLAAIAGVLVAGSQLSDLGSLDSHSHRLYLAIAALAVAGLATAAILMANVWVATTPAHTLTFLASSKRKPSGVTAILKDTVFLGGLTTVESLKTEYEKALQEQQDAYNGIADPALITPAEVSRISTANARATGLNQITIGLLSSVAYAWIAFRWRRAAAVLLVAGLVAAASIATFAWAATPPASAKESAATPAQVDSPTPVTITLTPAGQQALKTAIGNCDPTRPFNGLKLAAGATGVDVVILRQGQTTCGPARFVAGADWATVCSS
ncbi:hypothetical protein E0H75_42655 [Kribbella capetownensis]|uniref:Uncharacterized protein n=1 Tax=Kribbella capetownensis TaxID=1572659 RepID=A0A4R0IV83_9ACTN|nr:hypothetical protein [Kribbella capetownensis]TCC32645.1 hypothetical protein E0H75_42655 [Kribbella capetownensis]